MNPFLFEKDEIYLKKLGFELLEEYMPENSRREGSDTGQRRVVIQDNSGYKYDVFLRSLAYSNPEFVNKQNPFSLDNIKLWLKLNKKHFSLFSDTVYSGSNAEMMFYCSDCDDIFHGSWNDIFGGKQGCPVCRGLQVGEKHSLAIKRPELLKEWSPNNIISPYDVAEFSHKKVYWICQNCDYGKNNEWFSEISNRTNMNTHCPKCASSIGEKIIFSLLSVAKIKKIHQKRFDDCKDKYTLPFDFYLPSYNVCIEYHGEQHYYPVDFAGRGKEWAIKEFKELKRRDKIKMRYCKKNNIGLFIIPYWKQNDIESILRNLLNKQGGEQ